MSNFKQRFNSVRENRLEKTAVDAIQPAQNTVKEDSDMTGYTTKIEEALRVSIQPTSIDGFIETFSGELNIAMSNGDDIQLKYNIDEETNVSTNELIINGQNISLPPNFDPSQLTNSYKQFLGM